MTSNSIVRRGLERIGAATVVIGLFILLLRIGQHFVARATPNRTNEYRLPPYYAAVGLICGAFAGLILGMGMLGGMSPARGDFAAWLGLVLFFGGGAVYLVVCAGNWRLWLDENGIQKRDYWGRTGRFTPWTEILRVRKGRYHFHFDVRLGERISLPFQVPGLLEAMLGAYFNGADFDHKARETLEAVWSELGFEEPLWWVGA